MKAVILGLSLLVLVISNAVSYEKGYEKGVSFIIDPSLSLNNNPPPTTNANLAQAQIKGVKINGVPCIEPNKNSLVLGMLEYDKNSYIGVKLSRACFVPNSKHQDEADTSR